MWRGAAVLGLIDEPLIALIGDNRPEWLIAYLAIVSAGKTVVPVDCHLKVGEFAAILRHSDIRTVVRVAIVSDDLDVTIGNLDQCLRRWFYRMRFGPAEDDVSCRYPLMLTPE